MRMKTIYLIPLTFFSHFHADTKVSSNPILAVQPNSSFAKVVSAQIFSISPSRRLTIL